MNKQEWLKEALSYIDSLNSEEFEAFLTSCVPCYRINIDYRDIQLGKAVMLSDAANMDTYCTVDICLAA
jgi:hypothetical protein